MNAISQNHSDFAARLSRIEANIVEHSQLLFVGMDEVYVMPRRDLKTKVSSRSSMLRNAMYPISMVAAVVLGAVSHGLGQVARYHVQGMPDLKANPDVEMLVQVIVGVLISVLLGYFLRLNARGLTSLKSAGVVLGVLFMHNAVHLYPRAFEVITSAQWVNQIDKYTKPYSLLWRGISLTL